MLIENEYRVIGPPGCLAGDSLISTHGDDISIPTRLDTAVRRVLIFKHRISTQSEIDGKIERLPIVAAVVSGAREVWRVTTECGKSLKLTPDHRIRVRDGYARLWSIYEGDEIGVNDNGIVGFSRVASVEENLGWEMTYDLTVGHPSGEGNFVANGIIVHNCGKTTYLADQVQKRVAKWCEDNDQHSMQCHDVLLASLTRTAAAEIRTRGLAIPAEQVGTLHAHALRALGKPKLCVSPKAIADWNKESPMEFWRSEGASAMAEEGISLGKYNGDALFSEYTTNRCRLTPREQWRGQIIEFAKAYESWKYRNDYLDYDDLIIRAYEEDTDPPGNPSTILGDEQQDSSAAEFRLMRHWATKINKLILVGDSDQSIFQFRGGDPDGMFASEVPPDHEKVLEQSYRVPRAVHAEAMRVIERVSHRKPVVYYPRDEDGDVERTCWSMRTAPYEAVDQIARLLDEPDERPGTPKAMCIFSCAYQANALMSALRSAGIPYWNPYARERGNFNPLHPAKGVSTLDRILDYLRSSEACHGDAAAVWTWEQFQNWTELCSSEGWLRHGAKSEIKRRASATPSAAMTVEEIQALISHEDVLDDLAECSLEWLGQHIAETKKGIYSYVLDIVNRRGYKDITSPPRVVVGTAHSIKGSESENVFVCPDLSVSGWENYGDRDGRDSIFRLYYVALTRARKRLILTAPSCPQAIDL